MGNVFLVWDRVSFDDYNVILITRDEQKAKKISGEPEPCSWRDKINDETDRWYEIREMEREYI